MIELTGKAAELTSKQLELMDEWENNCKRLSELEEERNESD